MRASATAFAALALMLAAPAAADPLRSDRYELKPADGGFLRLDRESGEVAFCAPAGGGYACRPAAPGPAAPPEEIATLRERVAALEETVKRLSAAGAPGPIDGGPIAKEPEAGLPSEAEVERALSFVERAVRRFKRFAEDIERAAPPESERL